MRAGTGVGTARRKEGRMVDIAENPAPVQDAETRRAEVEGFLTRARETVARTREVIEATNERLGPRPSPDGAAE